MAKNVLFNFVDFYLAASEAPLPNCQSVKLDSTKEERLYYRFELEHTHPVVLQDGEYLLLDHHVSVYQTENQANPFLSQYHYTAYFKGRDGTRYQLHVYYNDQNDMTVKPVFSIQNETDGSFTPLESEQLQEDFINLARAYAKPLIKNIRKQLTDTVKALETQYSEWDREASLLATSIAHNHENYLATLREGAEIAKRLARLVKHDHYQNVYRYTQRMITAVTERYKLLETATETHSSSLVVGEKTSKETVSHSGEVKPSTPSKQGNAKKERVKVKPSPFDKKVQRIATEFNKLAKESDEIYATQLADLLARINELSLTLEDSETLVSLNSLTKLKNIQQQVQNEGQKLFARLVIKGEFKVAEQMPSFYYLLENYLEMALLTRNHRLLDFILQHGDVNINNQEVTVKGIVYPSAVHYCLSCDIRENPIADCLSVLIRHGASLFGSDESGLPIAHTILSTENHPLKKALTANRDKTIESIAFYKQLISTLKRYLAEHPSSSTDASIEKAIEYYQTNIERLRRVVLPTNSGERRLKSQLDAFTDKHDTDVMERVRQDKDVIALQKKVQTAANAFHKKLDYKQRMAFAKAGSQNLTNIDKALEYFGVKFDNFEELKQLTMEFLQHSLVLIAKQSELAELQKKIRGFPLKSGRAPSSYSRMLNEQRLLLDEIAEMENKYAVKDIEEIKNLDVGLQSLTTLSNQLNKITDSLKALSQLTSLISSDFNPPSEVDEEGVQEEGLPGISNVNTIFNMFAPLLQSVGRQTDTANGITESNHPFASNS
ncbi:hypothetical protein [Legionella sp. 29fVS95]|uniref:hypothetical protein n=1 Tax=Legionella sp. 29fVS95 TaxID=3402813 RepID=UPI003AF85EB1